MKLLKILAGTAAAAMFAVTLSACGSSDEASGTNEDTVTVEHAQGETEVPVNPDSVLTFDIASLDTMDALGVDAVTGVPKESLPDYLDKYGSDDYTNIGTLFEPDYEAIPETEPDLIIVAGRSAEAYDDLAEDFTVIDLTMDSTDYSASLEDRTQTLASIFDAEEQAGDALEELQQRTEAIKDAAGDQGTGLVLLTSGGKVTAFGTGSRYDWIHSEFGVEPAVENVKHEGHHGEAVSFEYIQEADPDWIFVVDRDAAIGEEGKSAEQVLDNDLVAQTTAWKEDQVVYLDPEAWYIVAGGLTSTSTMIDQFEEAFGV